MAPSSANRRTSARKRVSTSRQQSNIAATNDSPSRPAKRRRTQATAPAIRRQRQTREAELAEEPVDDESSEEEEIATLSEPADAVIAVLKTATYEVVASLEHPNREQDETITAYAKIAGKNWTYYVREASINIGRSPDQRHPSESHQGDDIRDEETTHIDLGPHKLVSRVHAQVFFNSESERWHIKVLGRNGVRINEELLRKDQQKRLDSGDVLEIAGTEMIFVSPDVQAAVNQKYLDRLNPQNKVEEANSSEQLSHGHPQPQDYNTRAHISPYAPNPLVGQQIAPAAQPNPAERQSTPVKTLMQAPYLSQNAAPLPQSLTTHHPNQPTMMETNEQQTEHFYASDAMKHVKPPMSYATLIGQAILSGPDEKLSLNGIYEWIKQNFSYYRHIEQSWQNSIRHNLSLNAAFLRVDRGSHAPGKGGLWYIVPDKIEEHRKGGLKITSRGGARQSSNPSSPAPKRSPKKRNTPPKRNDPTDPGSSSQIPASTAFEPSQADAQTPSRAPRGSALAYVDNQHLPQLSDDASPLPTRAPYLSQNTAGGRSPPTLSSSAYFDDANSTFLTPAPRRHEPQLAAPSTQKLPSQYLPQSSPAPFWQAVGKNTPARLPDTSPLKADPVQSLQLQSSSPPPLANGSPTRPRAANETNPRVNGFQSGPGRLKEPSPEVGDEEDTLDLMGNFPKIGEQNMVSSAAH